MCIFVALINLLKFLTTHESHLVPNHDIFQLATQVVNVFNVFITYGDMFLSNSSSYDELYYEIIRTHQIFDNLFSMGKNGRFIQLDPMVVMFTFNIVHNLFRCLARVHCTVYIMTCANVHEYGTIIAMFSHLALRYTTTDGQWKDSAIKLTTTLSNIRTIINHFTPKVDKWATVNSLSALTEEQVRCVNQEHCSSRVFVRYTISIILCYCLYFEGSGRSSREL